MLEYARKAKSYARFVMLNVFPNYFLPLFAVQITFYLKHKERVKMNIKTSKLRKAAIIVYRKATVSCLSFMRKQDTRKQVQSNLYR